MLYSCFKTFTQATFVNRSALLHNDAIPHTYLTLKDVQLETICHLSIPTDYHFTPIWTISCEEKTSQEAVENAYSDFLESILQPEKNVARNQRFFGRDI